LNNSKASSVVFKVQGGHDVGMGHIYRSICLADALTESGMVVDSFFCNPDKISRRFLECRGYDVNPYVGGTADKAILSQYLSENMIDGIILDQPVPEPALLGTLRVFRIELFVAALDYSDLTENRLDLIVNLYNHNHQFQAPQSKSGTCVEGLSYAIIRPDFDPYIIRKKTIRKHSQDILVSFGGGDPRGNTELVLDTLTAFQKGNMRFHVVIGPNLKDKEVVCRKAAKLHKIVRLYKSVTNMAELMFFCDFGLHGAGTMMLEMAALGTPSIVLPQNETEWSFGRFFVDHDVVKMPGYADNLNKVQLAEIIASLGEDSYERKRMSRAGKALVDGKGRWRITKLIQKGIQGTKCRDFLL